MYDRKKNELELKKKKNVNKRNSKNRMKNKSNYKTKRRRRKDKNGTKDVQPNIKQLNSQVILALNYTTGLRSRRNNDRQTTLIIPLGSFTGESSISVHYRNCSRHNYK